MNKLAPRGTTTAPPPGVILRPVVGLDLDGTMFDWHDDFLHFAHRWLHGRDTLMPEGWLFLRDGRSMARHLGVTPEVYRQVKLAYRQSGLKRDLRAFPGARPLVCAVRGAGAEVWACTTRPYLRLDNVDPDTRELLDRNEMVVDGVVYGEHKYRDLCELVGADRVVGVLDDLPEMVDQARYEGLPAMLIQRHHNQAWWAGLEKREVMNRSHLPSLPDLPAAQEWLLAEIKDWKAKYDVV